MNYDEAVSWLQTMLWVPQNNSDENFQRIIPAMFLYAEGRIYRELDFLATTTSQPTLLTARVREFELPTNVLVLRNINICTPTGPITNTSKRTPLERISPEALDFFWPQASLRPGLPQKYAVIGKGTQTIAPPAPPGPQTLSHLVRLMPEPDLAYTAELLGVIRPDTLSKTNPQTYLSITYPELFMAACMVFGSGYQRDFGAQADDPQRAVSWESIYGQLRGGIMLEAARQRGEGPGWTAATPAPAAQPRAP